VVTLWADIAISFDVALPAGAIDGEPVYVFVTNDGGDTNLAGFGVPASIFQQHDHSVTFSDDGTYPGIATIMESLTGDYLSGWSFKKRIADDVNNEEDMVSVSTTTSLPASTFNFQIAFPTGKPDKIAGDRIIAIYDENIGDIRTQSSGEKLKSTTFVSPLTSTC
jgi:hypothetical protein